MGLFDDVIGKGLPGGGIGKPIAIALGALLLRQIFSHGSSQTQAPSPTPSLPSSSDGGLLGGLGGLLEKFKQAGQQETMNSWIGTGPNKPIEPGPLGTTLGKQTISDLARQAGISEQELLDGLAKALPNVVNGLTPKGRLPTVAEVGGG